MTHALAAPARGVSSATVGTATRACQLRFDRAVDVAVDSVGADAVDDSVCLQHGADAP